MIVLRLIGDCLCGVTPPCSQACDGINLIISVEISKIWMLLFGDYKIKAYFCVGLNV